MSNQQGQRVSDISELITEMDRNSSFITRFYILTRVK